MDTLLTADMQFNLAMVGELITFLYGLPLVLAPHKKLEVYGVEEKMEFKSEAEKLHVLIIVCEENLALITCSIIFFLIAFKDFDREVAIGVSTVPWLILMLFSLLNEIPQKVGNPTKDIYTNIIVFAFVEYTTIMETDYSTLAVKLLSGFTLTHGLFLLLFPATHAAFWGNTEGRDVVMFSQRCAGANLLNLGVFGFSLIAELPLVLCCGLGWVVAFFTMLLLLSDCRKFDIDMSKIYGWIVVIAFFAVTLLVQPPAVVQEEVVKED
jgi:hypothetical protein